MGFEREIELKTEDEWEEVPFELEVYVASEAQGEQKTFASFVVHQ